MSLGLFVALSECFQIWDTGDPNLGSTVLVDSFRWLAEAGTVPVQTTPTPR